MPDHTIVGVFDGHGGVGAAQFSEKTLPHVLQDSREWKEYFLDPEKSPRLLGNALIAAFIELDKLLQIHQKSGSRTDISGCTAVVCIITPKYYVCANAGLLLNIIISQGH